MEDTMGTREVKVVDSIMASKEDVVVRIMWSNMGPREDKVADSISVTMDIEQNKMVLITGASRNIRLVQHTMELRMERVVNSGSKVNRECRQESQHSTDLRGWIDGRSPVSINEK